MKQILKNAYNIQINKKKKKKFQNKYIMGNCKYYS